MSGRLNQTMASSKATPVHFSANQPRRLQDEDALFPITKVKTVKALLPLFEKSRGGDHMTAAMLIHAPTHISVIIFLHNCHKNSAYETISLGPSYYFAYVSILVAAIVGIG